MLQIRFPMRLLRFLLCVSLTAGLLPHLSAAGMTMSTLQNLPAVGVKVRGLSPDGMTLGLSEAELVQTVSAALQKVGVRVARGPEVDQLPGGPPLEVTANITPFGVRSHLFIVRLELRENVKFVRKTQNLVTVPAITWDAETDGSTTKIEVIRAKLAELAERFAAEWSEAGAATGK